MGDFQLGDYVQVNERIVEFREKYPEGSLQPARLDEPYEIVDTANGTYIVYGAAAYRTPDDERPGIGYAWEPFPGKTPYTKNSELMNAETSAWGRAIIAVLAADAKRGIASAEEVRNRAAERDEPPEALPWPDRIVKLARDNGTGAELRKHLGLDAKANTGDYKDALKDLDDDKRGAVELIASGIAEEVTS